MKEVISVKCSGGYILMWWTFGELTLLAEVDVSSNICWSLLASKFPAIISTG